MLQNKTREKLWICLEVDGVVKVLDVTDYVHQHPGGIEVITDVAGKNWEVAHQAFEDIGHVAEARATMREYIIGDLKFSDDREKVKDLVGTPPPSPAFNPYPVLLLLLAIAAGFYYQSQQSEVTLEAAP